MRRPNGFRIQEAIEKRDNVSLNRLLGLEAQENNELWRAIDAGLGARSAAALAVAAADSPDPRLSLMRLLELGAHFDTEPDTWSTAGRRALACALGTSEAVARYLRTRPQIAAPIIRGDHLTHPKPLGVMRHELQQRRAAARDDEALRRALRRYRVREWVRITARELARLQPVEIILLELSDLAEAVIDTATRYHLRRERSTHGPRHEGPQNRPAGFAIVAQGKLGGHELNLSSDVDLQLVYSSDDTPAKAKISLHERFCTVGRQIIQTLTGHSPDGFCYRVDLDLRPEGSKGPLANSVAAAESYYQSWGQSWERLALIRARPIAGQRWVGQQFLAAVRPFAFPRSLDPTFVDEILGLLQREQEERRHRALSQGLTPTMDIKRDSGGIRQLELFVQIQQLLGGGRDRLLRNPALLAAVEQLRFVGALPQKHADEIADTYACLRRLENALQAVDERQTHSLPRDRLTAERLAKLLGFDSDLMTAAEIQRAAVNRITAASLVASDQPSEAPRHHLAYQALTTSYPPPLAILADLGFGAAEEAAHHLTILARGTGGPFCARSPERIRRLAAPLLDELAHSPDPDLALRLWVDLDTRLRRQPGYFELLETVPVRRRLVDLLGQSELLGRTIIRYPVLLDWLAEARDAQHLGRRRPAEELELAARERIRKVRDQGGDLELELRSLRRFKLQEQLRVGILDLAKSLGLEQVLTHLSDLAVANLRIACELAAESLGLETSGFAVLGLGSLGGHEMGYGSDLDLIFVFDSPFATGYPSSQQQAVRLAQRLVQQITFVLPEGRLYAIDTRLRPSGNQGPLVSSRSGFVGYHRAHAMLWERQALLRARPVAGDLMLGAEVLDQLSAVRYPPESPAGAAAEIHRLRQRMQNEIAGKKPGLHIKAGRGGLAELEFVVQYLLLKHAGQRPELRVTGTLRAVRELFKAGLLARDQAQRLEEAYVFWRRLENRLRMVHDSGAETVRLDHPNSGVLARRMGYRINPTAELKRESERIAESVRGLYDTLIVRETRS